MNGKTIKKINKQIRRHREQHFVDTFNALCRERFVRRVKIALRIMRGKGIQ